VLHYIINTVKDIVKGMDDVISKNREYSCKYLEFMFMKKWGCDDTKKEYYDNCIINFVKKSGV
jgi:hypothetical protein